MIQETNCGSGGGRKATVAASGRAGAGLLGAEAPPSGLVPQVLSGGLHRQKQRLTLPRLQEAALQQVNGLGGCAWEHQG